MLLVVVGCAFAQEPVKFRGAWIGQPLSDYVDCSSGKAKKLLPQYRTHGNICAGKRGLVFHTKTKGFMDLRRRASHTSSKMPSSFGSPSSSQMKIGKK